MTDRWGAFLFDLNGVLVDDEPLHCEMYQRALRGIGVSMSRREYYEKYLGFDDRGAFQAVLRDRGRRATPRQVDELVARKALLYDRAIRTRMRLFPGARGLVQRCARRAPVGVVTGALRAEAELILGTAGLLRFIDVIVAAEDVSRGKPDPEGYLRAYRLLRRRPGGGGEKAERELRPATPRGDRNSAKPSLPRGPSRCLAVEDSPAGIRAAHGAGMRVLGVAHTYPARELSGADWLVPNLRGLRLPDLNPSRR